LTESGENKNMATVFEALNIEKKININDISHDILRCLIMHETMTKSEIVNHIMKKHNIENIGLHKEFIVYIIAFVHIIAEKKIKQANDLFELVE